MKIITLILFVLGACAVNPHRVCSITTIVDKGGTCESLGRNLGPQASDVGIWRPSSGGVRWCVSTLDPKEPLACFALVPSPTEQAQAAIRAQAPMAPAAPAPAPAPIPQAAPIASPPAVKDAPKP